MISGFTESFFGELLSAVQHSEPQAHLEVYNKDLVGKHLLSTQSHAVDHNLGQGPHKLYYCIILECNYKNEDKYITVVQSFQLY